MIVVYLVVSITLAIIVLASAAAKLTRSPRVMDTLVKVGVKPSQVWLLAACEIAGGIGLLIGVWLPVIGIAAAVGIVLYFLGAVVAHLRVGDRRSPEAPVILVIAIAALVLRALTP